MIVILVRPEKVSNLGAVCRLMANFDGKKLVLVNSHVDATDIELIMTARRALHYFYDAKQVQTLKEALEGVSYSIATTARVTGGRTPRRIAYSIDSIPFYQLDDNSALVFGPENTGLLNEEIEICNFLLTIPTHKDYPSLNLSHAVAILLSEIYQRKLSKKITENKFEDIELTENWIPPKEAPQHLIQILLKKFDNYTDQFVEKYRKELTKQVFRKVINRANINDREASRLIGAFEAWEFHWNNLNKK